jgi:hypothetical protein
MKKRTKTIIKSLLILIGILVISFIAFTTYIFYLLSGGGGRMDDVSGYYEGQFLINDTIEDVTLFIEPGDTPVRGYMDVEFNGEVYHYLISARNSNFYINSDFDENLECIIYDEESLFIECNYYESKWKFNQR